jgi:F0F1-type ATP synthase membrane subunit c/vacuolar-type H+-ATPase subunit K
MAGFPRIGTQARALVAAGIACGLAACGGGGGPGSSMPSSMPPQIAERSLQLIVH